jgi:cytochrome c oxidase assembly protein subunit 15
MLLWLWLTLRAQHRPVDGGSVLTGNRLIEDGSRVRLWATLALAALALQVFLGGWTSSNYAAVACPDFPRCQAQWIPDADYQDAFVLWRGLGINYAGGVLDHPARVAIPFHASHRRRARHLLLLVAALGSLRGLGRGRALGRDRGAGGAGACSCPSGYSWFCGLPAAAGGRPQRGRRAARRSDGNAEPEAPAVADFS